MLSCSRSTPSTAYGVLDDMGMAGPVIRILRMSEHGIKQPVRSEPLFRSRHGKLKVFHPRKLSLARGCRKTPVQKDPEYLYEVLHP